MTQEEIIEGELLIGRFMKVKLEMLSTAQYPDRFPHVFDVNNHLGYTPSKYHSSWDWLMPVVEKIESLGFNVEIHSSHCLIIGEKLFGSIPFKNDSDFSKIKCVYQSIIQFIKWYNQSTQQ